VFGFTESAAHVHCGTEFEQLPINDRPGFHTEALETCELESAGAWPQPVGGVAQVSNGDFTALREGVIWQGAGGGTRDQQHPLDLLTPDGSIPAAAGEDAADAELWLYSLNTPAELLPPGFDETLGPLDPGANNQPGSDYATTEHVDAHLMWKYETATRSWRPQPSVLNNRPVSRTGAGRWADETGSLFVFSGEQSARFPGSEAGGSFPARGPQLYEDLWRFDTTVGEWSLISAGGPTAGELEAERIREEFGEAGGGSIAGGNTGDAGVEALKVWPPARQRSTIWLDAASPYGEHVVWMFGGMQAPQEPAGRDLPAGTSELWQYRYSYASEQPDLATAGQQLDGEGVWTLVAMNGEELSDFDRVPSNALAGISLLCLDQPRAPTRWANAAGAFAPDPTLQCPEARMDAGSWSGVTKSGGWIFGGTAVTPAQGADADNYVGVMPPATGQLRDLWYFNGKTGINQVPPFWSNSVWSQVLPPASEGGVPT